MAGKGRGGELLHRGGANVDLVNGLLHHHLGLLHVRRLLAAGRGRGKDPLSGTELVRGGLGLLVAVLGGLKLALELLHPQDVGVGDGLLLLKLPLVHLDLLVQLVKRVLENDDVLPVLL